MRCMCGALDCASCFPGTRDPVSCSKCDNVIPNFFYEEAEWEEINGSHYCRECYAIFESDLKAIADKIVRERGVDNCVSVKFVTKGEEGVSDMCLVLCQTGEMYVESLMDLLDALRIAFDDVNISISIKFYE